ncbi:hypothetical protein BY996DRAFT_6617703 [Phakopsora pachyrhizi]|nr:hypothetical protein BY996DRAFT_6617703 [Phakopsora pachyrhizi]
MAKLAQTRNLTGEKPYGVSKEKTGPRHLPDRGPPLILPIQLTNKRTQERKVETSVLIGRGGAGNMVIKRSKSADWATQINQDLTVEEELVTFVETDGVSSEESSPACSTGELVNQDIISLDHSYYLSVAVSLDCNLVFNKLSFKN